MGNSVYLIGVLLLSNFLFLKNISFISQKYNLYDNPDEKRKKQKKPVPLLGGLLFLTNLIIFLFFDYFFYSKNFLYSLGFVGELKIAIFCLTIMLVFFIGFVDDKIKIKPSTKLILLSVLLYIIFVTNPKIVINSLNFYFYINSIDLFGLGILFSVLCVLTYINSLNMMDGVNLISAKYYLSIVLVLFLYNFQFHFALMFLIFTLFFIFLNRDGKAFLGDSGVYIISVILSLLIISLYEKNNLNVEIVFLLMFLPTFDFFRLIISRILKKRHPFQADENHFHHIVIRNYGSKGAYILNFFIFTPILLINLPFINSYLIIMIMIFLYFFFLNKKPLTKIKD